MSIHQAMWDATNEEEEPLSVLGAATEARARTNAEWTDAVREASRFHSLRAVGVAAGISHARVAQIVGRRPAGLVDLTLRCPTCGKRADVCFAHGDEWKKRPHA